MTEREPKIMIVDDEPIIGELLMRLLGRHDYEVLFFTSAKEALVYLKNPIGDINLLLTDMMMPEITGLELARQAKTLYPAIPIIIMSGSADEKARDEIFSLGADFIAKPFKFSDLLKRIDSRITESVMNLILKERG